MAIAYIVLEYEIPRREPKVNRRCSHCEPWEGEEECSGWQDEVATLFIYGVPQRQVS